MDEVSHKMDVQLNLKSGSDELTQNMKKLEGLANSFSEKITGGLKDAVKQGKSLKDIFKSMAMNLADSALDAALLPLQSILSSGITAAFSGGKKSASPLALPSMGFLDLFRGALPFAKGGVVSSPSYFPMGSSIGLMGEAGAEAVMPLARSADGRLGVRTQGGGQASASIQVNISSPNVESFRRSEGQVTAALTRAVQRGTRNL